MSRDTVGNEDAWALDGRGLRHRLLRPADQVDLPGLAARWFRQTIRLVCPNAGPLALDPGLPGQIRGALGHVLLAAASEPARAGRPCCWSPPCAYDVVFGDHGRIASGEEMPKPLVLSVDALDQDLLVRATLFGFATDWIDAVAEALAVALGRVNTAVSRERAATILPDGAPARAAGRQSFLVSAQPQGRRPRVTATPLRLVPAER
ncbi:MAG: hypothetical protein GVY13_11620, partial [Alphaproteobacteria bacterium]|nr:hypothetical protein [Alphaproteobacteria bacterium]